MVTSTALLVALPFIAIIEGRKEGREQGKKNERLHHLKPNIKKKNANLLIDFAFYLRF